MKRCPECDSSFPDTDKFCELDGASLVADYSDQDPNVLVSPADPDPESDSDPYFLVSPADPDPESDSDPDFLVSPADPDPESDSDSRLLVATADQGPEPDVPPEVRGTRGYQDSRASPPGQNWKTLAIVAVAGVAMGVVLFIVYHRLTREPPEQSSIDSANDVAVTQQPMPLLLSPPTPFASASPSAEPSPSPSARPTPAAKVESTSVALSSSPVSTGGSETNRRGPVTILLTDGTRVEAEEVWETGEGIWYRRRGLVTLLKRNQVKAIDQPPTARPSPAAKTAPSPSASP